MSESMYGNGDDDVTGGLRALYAAPAGHAYWNELESRIMARVASVEMAWWDEFDRWVRPALAVAAVLVVAAGVAYYRSTEVDQNQAYTEILTPTPNNLPHQASARPLLQGDRDAALRYLIAPAADSSRKQDSTRKH